MIKAGSFRLPGYAWYRQGRLWVAPTAGALSALVLGVGVLLLDHYVLTSSSPFPKFVDSDNTARALLTVTATSIATLTALVLTIVTIVFVLASDKYSHRALRTLLQDPQTHLTLGTFVGTFTYALLALLGMGATLEGNPGQVVGVTVPVAFVLAVFSIGAFVSYIDHIMHYARGTSIVHRIGHETLDEIDRIYTSSVDDEYPYQNADVPDDPDHVINADHSGIVFELDTDRLVKWATGADATLVLVPTVGDFVPTDAPLVKVYGETDEDRDVVSLVRLDPERTITDDVGFGFRLLVDIAEHAISPAINDPTTTVQCIDQLHDLLRRLALRHFPSGWHTDDIGNPRLFVRATAWSDFVALACDEIRIYGVGHIQVSRRMRAMLEDIRAVAPEERRPPIDRQLRLLDAANQRAFADAEDQESAQTPDLEGIGGARRVGSR